jgi:predicted DNA-binding protein
MRITLDLPDDLYKRLKLLAVQEGKPLREIVLRCLEEGLNRQATSTAQPTLPVVPCGRGAG